MADSFFRYIGNCVNFYACNYVCTKQERDMGEAERFFFEVRRF